MKDNLTLAQLAAAVDGRLVSQNPDRVVSRPVHPDDAVAGQNQLAVALAPAFVPLLADCAADMALVAEGVEPPANITDYIAIRRGATAMAAMTTAYDQPRWITGGVHPTAYIDPAATIGDGVTIGAFVVVGPNSTIGANSVIYPHVTIGANVTIGEASIMHSGVRLYDDTQVGARVIIHGNAVIGADGFSFITAQAGSVEQVKSGSNAVTARNTELRKIGSLGPVIIGDDVEIGAATTIDRATLRATRIGRGTKIDNLVQIGHNVEIGENCMICGQVGIAGSVKIGDRVVLAGRSGLADNIIIGADAVIGAAAGVGGNVPAGSIMMGTPAVPRDKFRSIFMATQRLPRLMEQLETIRDRIKSLENKA